MRELTAKQFAELCFMVATRGYYDRPPEHITQKSTMLNRGFAAFRELSESERYFVMAYLDKWALPFPEEERKYIPVILE